MKRKTLMILCSFVVSISLLVQITLPVYASATTEESDEFLGYTPSEWANGILKSVAEMENGIRLLLEDIGVIFNPDLWGTGQLFELYKAYMVEKQLIESADDYFDYLDSHAVVEKNEDGEDVLIFDTDFVNTVYSFATHTIEEYKSWYDIPTVTKNEVSALSFTDKELFDWITTKIDTLNGNEVLFINAYAHDDDGVWLIGSIYDNTVQYVKGSDYYCTSVVNPAITYNVGGYCRLCCVPYDENWNSLSGTYHYYYYSDGTSKISTNKVAYGANPLIIFDRDEIGAPNIISQAYTSDGRILRLYRTTV